MRVLFISNDPSMFISNSDTRVRMLSYAEAVGELHIVSTAPLGAHSISDGPLHLYPVHVPWIFRVHVMAEMAHALIHERTIDVVSAQDPFEHGLAALRAVRGTRAKLHIQVHTDFLSQWFVQAGNWRSPRVRMPLFNYYRRQIADGVLPHADGIRTVSERVKGSLIARYESSIAEPSVIPLPVEPGAPPPVRLPDHPFTFSLITVGRLEPEKRIEDILAALKLVVAQYPMVGLFIVGDGRERSRLARMIRSLDLSQHVRLVGGWMPHERAWGLMRSAHAYIQASAYEGYSRTLVEAALARIPIITTDVGIVGEVFKGYRDVLSVPVADPTALSLSIVGLIEDTVIRQELPINAELAVHAHLAAVGNVPGRIAEDFRRLLEVT